MVIALADVYDYIMNHPGCTRKDIRKELGTNERLTAIYTNSLVSKGVVDRTKTMPPKYSVVIGKEKHVTD